MVVHARHIGKNPPTPAIDRAKGQGNKGVATLGDNKYLVTYEGGRVVEVLGTILRGGKTRELTPAKERADPENGEKGISLSSFPSSFFGESEPGAYYVYREIPAAEQKKVMDELNSQGDFSERQL